MFMAKNYNGSVLKCMQQPAENKQHHYATLNYPKCSITNVNENLNVLTAYLEQATL